MINCCILAYFPLSPDPIYLCSTWFLNHSVHHEVGCSHFQAPYSICGSLSLLFIVNFHADHLFSVWYKKSTGLSAKSRKSLLFLYCSSSDHFNGMLRNDAFSSLCPHRVTYSSESKLKNCFFVLFSTTVSFLDSNIS